jgi:hypothetical protein
MNHQVREQQEAQEHTRRRAAAHLQGDKHLLPRNNTLLLTSTRLLHTCRAKNTFLALLLIVLQAPLHKCLVSCSSSSPPPPSTNRSVSSSTSGT